MCDVSYGASSIGGDLLTLRVAKNADRAREAGHFLHALDVLRAPNPRSTERLVNEKAWTHRASLEEGGDDGDDRDDTDGEGVVCESEAVKDQQDAY